MSVLSKRPSSLAYPVSRLRARAVDWLWPWRLALGKLALLDGDPGLGKSLLALDLCARLTTGRPWPDGGPPPAPAPVLILNGEDGEEDTLAPRLRALGADLSRVFILPRARPRCVPPLALPAHTRGLERALLHTGARLLVLDPLPAFLGPGVHVANDASIRRALLPLECLARRYACAALLVRHLTKGGGGRALYRGLGSIGLIGACRSAWLVAADPHEPARRVLAQVKNNLAPPQPSLAFAVSAADGGLPTLRWLGPVAQQADALLAPRPARPRLSTPRETAREFLLEFLRDGPRTTRDIWYQGEAMGLPERTLRRAKDELSIRLAEGRDGSRRVAYWLLPEQELPPDVRGQIIDPELDAVLRQLREQYPPATPLDDFETI